ncbi:MAG: hypothetical protein IJB93_03980 [Clostridia bacterium]|nr:hypothetical protein [Clostridia bacterium]
MKKLISLLLVTILSFSLCACNQTGAPENPDTGSAADYLSDETVMIVSEKAELDEAAIKKHYSEGGIVLIRNWELASEVQKMIATTITTEFTSDDLAVIFYKMADSVPGISLVQGNSTDLDTEIDEMIESAKTTQ